MAGVMNQQGLGQLGASDLAASAAPATRSRPRWRRWPRWPRPMIRQMGGSVFGLQVGQAIGALASEVVSGTEVGLPLVPAGAVALLPDNIKAFGEGLDVPADEVRLYLGLREAARARLFAHVPWLGPQLLGAVEAYARGIRIDSDAIESAMREVDGSDPASIQQALAEGLFEPHNTPGPGGRPDPARDAARPGRGLGRAGHRRGRPRPPAARRRDARDRTPAPRHRRAGRAHVRLARRPRAAAAPAARGGGPVGRAGRGPRSGGPRRGLGPPRPAARRPRTWTTRPGSPRRAGDAAQDSAEVDAAIEELLRGDDAPAGRTRPVRPVRPGRPTRPAREQPRRSARARPARLGPGRPGLLAGPRRRADPAPGRLPGPPGRAPGRAVARRPARAPDGERLRARPRPSPRPADPAPQGRLLGPVRRPPGAGRRHARRRRRCARPARSPASTGCACSGRPTCTGTRSRRRSAAARSTWTRRTRFRRRTARSREVSAESLDVAWFPVDALPEAVVPDLPARLARVLASV